ncbi:MAG: D-aminoacyl-tRNA deacylase [Vulcanimicrobiaceae bacterium]
MRAVVQRVKRAEVRACGAAVGAIGEGLCVLLGVGVDDTTEDAQSMAAKVAGLRIFRDGQGLMNRSIIDARGSVLLVSQFTLHGDARKGKRPSFTGAAPEAQARPLYEAVGTNLERQSIPVAYGRFGATMEVELVNDGPVTILLDSKRAF